MIIVIVHLSQEQTLMPVTEESTQKLVEAFVKFYGIHYDEVAIHFVDTPRICELHAQFFDDPTPTDCISFPMDDPEEEGYKVLGDVFVCPATALNYVHAKGGDTYQELTLYVVHGLLHLIGYDDIDEEDRKDMRSEEKRFLSHVRANKLWLKS